MEGTSPGICDDVGTSLGSYGETSWLWGFSGKAWFADLCTPNKGPRMVFRVYMKAFFLLFEDLPTTQLSRCLLMCKIAIQTGTVLEGVPYCEGKSGLFK